MKRSKLVVIGTVVTLVALNLIPFKTGPTVTTHCGMEFHTATLSVLGMPFGYLQNTTHTGCRYSLVRPGRETFKINNNDDGLAYDNYYFKVSAFAADAAIALTILVIVYIVANKKH
ncbi:MAG TPA: hypothetical protein VLF71_00345 [Candidatus Saccharimonadales bacterium]|nr:hypothetical protein [Candidatus Saccharimonadales bacterium]